MEKNIRFLHDIAFAIVLIVVCAGGVTNGTELIMKLRREGGSANIDFCLPYLYYYTVIGGCGCREKYRIN